MKRRTKYTNERMGELEVVDDFLPPPEQLVLREDKVKITIALSKSSVQFFKRAAKENKTQYQKMIRGVLDYYASKFYRVPGRRERATAARSMLPADARVVSLRH